MTIYYIEKIISYGKSQDRIPIKGFISKTSATRKAEELRKEYEKKKNEEVTFFIQELEVDDLDFFY